MTGPKISGCPQPGDIGEVDDDLARKLIAKGYAEDVSTLPARLGGTAGGVPTFDSATFGMGILGDGPKARPLSEPITGDGSGEALPPIE